MPDALVDTDVASTLYRAQLFSERAPVAVVNAVHDRNLFVSVVTLGEALYGATRRKWSPRRTARLRDFYTARFAVVPVDSDVVVEYARLRSATEGLGRPIADNDVWIGASATANGLPIVTLNRRHFEPLTLHGLTILEPRWAVRRRRRPAGRQPWPPRCGCAPRACSGWRRRGAPRS